VQQKQLVSVIIFVIIFSGTSNALFSLPSAAPSHSAIKAYITSIGLKWTYTTSNMIQSSPAVADVNGDGFIEVFITSRDRNLYCINHEGELEWAFTTGSNIWSSPAIADLDNDGTLEIVFGSQDNNIYCVNHEGELEWVYRIRKNIGSSATIADIDNALKDWND